MNNGALPHRVIRDMRHGGHAIAGDQEAATALSQVGWTRLSEAVQDPAATMADDTTAFGYLFGKLVGNRDAHLPSNGQGGDLTVRTCLALNDLGFAMIDQEPPADDRNSPIPPVYTYWGQFVDHDLTAATDNDSSISIRDTDLFPLPADEVVAKLANARHPALNLDSVYGDGPGVTGSRPEDPPGEGDDPIVVPYDAEGVKLALGTLTPTNVGGRIPPVGDNARDLPRRADRKPRIGDGRNDENLVVAQLHVAFLRFHNRVVDWVRENEPDRYATPQQVFERARQLVQHTYQWLTVNDFLATVLSPGATDRALAENEDVLDAITGTAKVFMPIEFATAAFRFGHSMIRGAYDWNRNFGRPNNNAPNATLTQLFQFTGTGGFFGAPTLPHNWPIEWDRFVDKNSAFGDRFTRRIDTSLALPLSQMVNQQAAEKPGVVFDIRTLLKTLARRNLLRGFRLDVPTGQAVAAELGVTALTEAEIRTGAGRATAAILDPAGFLTATPLWYYILLESQVKERGDALGEVGSRIVALTIVGQLARDPGSYLNQAGRGRPWRPSDGGLADPPSALPVRTIADFLRFAGLLS